MLDRLSSNPIILVLTLLFVAAGLGLYLTYFFDRIFIKKRLSQIDIIVLGFHIVLALYSAINAYAVFGQGIQQGLFSAWGRQMSIIGVVMMQYFLRARKVPVSTLINFVIVLCWIIIAFNFYMTMTVDPRTLVDTEMVGFNPSKGGYVFRFQSEPAMIGVIYFFVSFIVTRKSYLLVGWGIFMAYMLFIDKGRIDIISCFAVMGFVLVRNLTFIKMLRTVVFFGLLLTAAFIVIDFYFPSALAVLKNMLLNFVLAMVGIETGEGSIDARFIQFQIVFDFFAKYPQHMVFGTGILNREDMIWTFGELYLKDIGILGIFFAYGFVGLSILYGLFIYALRMTFKIKYYKRTLDYKITESLIVMMFISSFFNGGFVWAPGIFLILLLFLHALMIQEQGLRLDYSTINQTE